MSPDEFRLKLGQLRQICEDYSRTGTLDLIGEIEKSSLESDAKELIEKVKNLVINSDFEEALKTIAEI
jgi:hypothetical protein